MTILLINAEQLQAQLAAYDQFEQVLGKGHTDSADFRAIVEKLQASSDCIVKEVRIQDHEWSQVIGRRKRFRLKHASIVSSSAHAHLHGAVLVQAQVQLREVGHGHCHHGVLAAE